MAPYDDPRHRRPGAQAAGRRGRPTSTARSSRWPTTCSTTMYDAPGPRAGRPAGRRAEAALRLRPRRRARRSLDQPGDRREPRASGRTTRAACRCPACPARSSGPKEVHLTGLDLDGNEVVDRGRRARRPACFQHELDHLDGVLLLERLDDDQRKAGQARRVRELHARPAPSRVGAPRRARRPEPALTAPSCRAPPPRTRPPRLPRHARAGGAAAAGPASTPASTSPLVVSPARQAARAGRRARRPAR